MYSLFIKEIKGFFNSLTGYIVISVFLLINSLFMWVFEGPLNIPDSGYAGIDTLFIIAPWVFLFLIPAVTMRSFAEEKRSGTLELLLTRPLTTGRIISAKYLASVVMIVLALVPTLVYYFSVIHLGNPQGNIDHGGTWGSYAGLIMLACAYAAIGIFCSSLTDNLAISFLLSSAICLFFSYGFQQIGNLFQAGGLGSLFLSFGITDHYESMSRGVIDTRDIIYFLALVGIFLVITSSVLNHKKWIIFRVAAILIVSVALSFIHYRFDFTSEKRYTLSDYTKNTLENLDDQLSLNIYLEGDLNIPFHRMQQRLKETLEEFRVYAGKNLKYEFINPFSGKDSKTTDKLLNELVAKGLRPTNIIDRDKEGGSVEKLVLPGGIMKYQNSELPVNFLRNNPGASAEENINNSMETFEYELMRVISSFIADTTEKVAFIEGQGEFNEFQVADISDELRWSYQVDRGRIDGKPGILDNYEAVIIAGPQNAFNEQDKFVIDQYIMNGGKVLWFVDMVNASLDSISSGNAFLAMIKTLNIEDILFRYGVRLNPVLVQDVQCGTIPVNMALAGNPPDFRPAPWLYSPLLTAPHLNPITRNLNMIRTDFTGSVDTIEARKNIKKTVLLKTSQYSKIIPAPVILSLDEVRLVPREQEFTTGFLPVAVLLSGTFESSFRNRMLSGLFQDTIPALKDTGKSMMLVVADADIIRNEIRPTPQGIQYMPLGFDRYNSQTYGNKEFIINAIQYMTGHTGLIGLRSRELVIRLLDKNRLKNERRRWVLINVLGPPLLVIIAGFLYAWIRKKKYSVV